MDEGEFRDPPGVVAAGFGLALLCLMLPLAFIGAAFAGVALTRRRRRTEGIAVLVLGAACTAIGIVLLR